MELKKNIFVSFLALLGISCGNDIQVSNPKITEYQFLAEMYQDSYFPNAIVDKGKLILLKLCSDIEDQKPESPGSVYKLTHAATEKFNELNNEFGENGSEIETAARENIGKDIAHILDSYGYKLDIEEAMAPREW